MKKTKKFLSCLLVVILIVGSLPIVSLNVSAATAVKTQQEAVDWLKAQGGKSYNIDTSTDGTQCVEFVKVYVNWLMTGNPWSDVWHRGTGNGYEVWKNSLWSELGWSVYYNTPDFMPKPGDIFSSGTTAYGHTGVVISSDLKTALIADANADAPYNGTPVKIHTVNWRSASSNSAYGATHYIRPNFKANHTHNYNTFAYIRDTHPHYCYYKCSCGSVEMRTNETRINTTCSQCKSECSTTVSINKTKYKLGENVDVSWKKSNLATHYNVVIYKKNDNGEYAWYKTQFEIKSLNYSIPSLPVGSYQLWVQTYNSNYWFSDKSDWFHGNDSNKLYFTVENDVEVTSVSLNYDECVIYGEDTVDLEATVYPSDAVDKNIIWSSSDTSVATVDKNGMVASKGIMGIATITAKTSNGKTASCKIIVKLPQSERTIDSIELVSKPYFTKGQDIYPFNDFENLDFDINYTDGSKETVTFNDGCLSNQYVSYEIEKAHSSGNYEFGRNTMDFLIDGTYYDFYVYVKDYDISGMEITKLPDKTEYIKGVGGDSIDLSGLEVLITYTDGTTKIYKEDESYLYDDDEQIWGGADLYEMPLGKNEVRLDYRGWQTTFTINLIEDPYIKNPVTKIEITKKPSKVFDKAVDPSWICKYDDKNYKNIAELSGIDYMELCENYLVNKNMVGAELTAYFKDGTKKVFKFTRNCPLHGNDNAGWYFWEEENGRTINVYELGNYQAEVEFEGAKTTFTALSSNTPDNPDSNLTIEVDTTTAKAGDTVTVNVSLKNNPGFGGMAYDVKYDNSKLELVSYECKLGSGICTNSGKDKYSNKVNFQYAGTSNITGDGVLVAFEFKVKSNISEGFASVSVVPTDGTFFRYSNKTEIDFKAETVNGGIDIVNYVKGDINGDGKVNNRDAARLLQKLAGWDVACVEAVMDTNGDGKVNNRDAVRILQYCAGWDVILH